MDALVVPCMPVVRGLEAHLVTSGGSRTAALHVKSRDGSVLFDAPTLEGLDTVLLGRRPFGSTVGGVEVSSLPRDFELDAFGVPCGEADCVL
jgi:hypothetical protein